MNLNHIIDNISETGKFIYKTKDYLWIIIWGAGFLLLWIWNLIFLNKPAFEQITHGMLNTFIISVIAVLISFLTGWLFGVMLHFLEKMNQKTPYLIITFLLNIIRSIPQIIGILILYYAISILMQQEIAINQFSIIVLMAVSISLFQFLEIVDLSRERIRYYSQSDFVNAMLVCGIKEHTIINSEILLKSSLGHILNKLVAIFGSAIFLQCSVDFILSVGLSTKVSAVNFPITLGNLLARIDSKQDILAIGHSLLNPFYAGHLFFEHLQGLTVAFIIVFSLICINRIANGITERLEL